MATKRTLDFLDANGIQYVIIHHSPAYTAADVAATAHLPGQTLAKTVIVRLDDRLGMAVVPATREVDFDLLQRASAVKEVHLAAEGYFENRFDGCEIGAMPPFGNLFNMETYVDTRLAERFHIHFNAGSHTDVVGLRFDDFRRLVEPKVADISSARTKIDIHALQI